MNWKNLRSLFVVDEDGDKQQKETPVKEQAEKETSTEGNSIIKVKNTPPQEDFSTVNDNSIPQKPQAEKGQVQEQFVQHLLKAIESNNVEGVDYLEFKNTLQSFAKMPMDENLRYQSALTAVKTMGATEAKIFQSANFYLEILGKEEQGFKAAVQRGKNQKVDGQLQRIEDLKKKRQEGLDMIEKIKQEVQAIDKEMNTISEKVQKDQVAIDTKKNHFYASYEFVVNQIKRDVEKLKQFSETPKE